MKRIKLLIVAGTLALTLSAGQASQVTWGAYTSNGVGDASGTPLPIGDIILLGHFNLTDAQIAANGNNEAFLMANFVQYASAFVGDGAPAGPNPADNLGYWLANSNNSSNSLSIQNTQMYYWVFNASTTQAASQYGIFTNPTAASWKFPDDNAVPPTTITDLSDVQHTSQGILWGGYGTGTSKDAVSPLFNLKAFAAVPEPSTLALLTVGLLGGAAAVRKARRG